MAFRPLTEGDCGQVNPLNKLTSHITQDHTFAGNHGQIFSNSSDQLVEQFLQETRAMPQSFRMDGKCKVRVRCNKSDNNCDGHQFTFLDLMREMHEIESQKSALPPIPASAIKDQLHDDAWAQQYLQDGSTFHVSSINFITIPAANPLNL